MQRNLQRSSDKKIFGVCGGLGNYFEIDPSVIRIMFLAALIFFGSGFIVYLLLTLVMPKP